jgi:hypothetical protein
MPAPETRPDAETAPKVACPLADSVVAAIGPGVVQPMQGGVASGTVRSAGAIALYVPATGTPDVGPAKNVFAGAVTAPVPPLAT